MNSNLIEEILVIIYFGMVRFIKVEEKVTIRDLSEIKNKIIENNNSKILGEIVSQRSNSFLYRWEFYNK